MKLFDFLKEYGIFAKELRQRLNNKQILVNGYPEQADYDLGNVIESYDQGFFLNKLYDIPNYDKWSDQIMVFGLANLIGGESNIQNELTDFLKDWKMIQITKDQIIFVKIGENPTGEIFFHKESGKSTKKIEAPQEVDHTEEIEKLKADKAKVEKQLNNPGFIKNAPQFKIDAAQKRLDTIIAKLTEFGANESVVIRFKDFK